MTVLDEPLTRPPTRPLTYVWVPVHPIDRLTPDRGVAALADGRAVAVFLLSDGAIHVLDNIDPCSGASVLSRGLVGDVDGVATVASPLYKQRFELATGRCLDADVSVAVHDAHVIDGVIHVRIVR
jgi:nitrite reductase (NADH) small subunit